MAPGSRLSGHAKHRLRPSDSRECNASPLSGGAGRRNHFYAKFTPIAAEAIGPGQLAPASLAALRPTRSAGPEASAKARRMDKSLLATGGAALLLWMIGLPLLWIGVRGSAVRPARFNGLAADAVMLVHLLLLLLGFCLLIMGSGFGMVG